MRTMKLLILCFVVSGIVALTASPAEAVTVLWQSANTDIYLGEPYGNLELENPLAGTEMIKEYAVIEWMDADYDAGPPRWYDDWSVNDPIGIDGYFNEIWMRSSGHSIWTLSTVPSKTVSIHLHGDYNDGLADVLVDGILVARLDMGTPAPAVDNVLIIVKDLAHITHHIRVNDLGVGPNTGQDDVATMGAAALEKRIKWSQPPKPATPGNLYYGWNEISIYDGNQIVADDWQCDNDDPITDIHWWGSFKGWNNSKYPPDDQIPTSFHITIWNDIPANPADPLSFSHPNEVVWEIDCHNFRKKFVGWDYDPRTNCFEACFYYEQDLTEAEYFYQRSNPDGTPSIYWVSIAAQYPAGAITDNQWGWKTRRRFFNDDAVKIRKPTMPHIGDKYQEGKPIYWPDETQSWDMAFELTSRKIEEYAKWSQPPKYPPQGGTCYYGWDELSQFARQQIVADDWVCSTQDPVKDVHWWGSYIGWNDENPPHDAPDRFHIGVWTDVPVGPLNNFSHPGQMIHEWVVPRSALFETYAGCDEHPLLPVAQESCFYYEFKIPEAEWFYQEFDPAGNPTIYWLSISAIYVNDPIYPWGWKTRLRDIDSQAPDDAVRIFDPTAPAPGLMYVSGQPIWWPDESVSWDTAFELTSTRYGDEYTKWSQPPVRYDTEAYDGWNELSVYYWNQIVADDWRCDTDNPVTDVHWWGSFLGWSCEGQPPQIPDSFHIAIWTDIPAGVDEEFSHPGRVIWETVCKDFTSKFVGWDIDPRDPNAPPEACFKFEQDLPEEEWFYQKSGGNIYWISIAAQYPTGTDVEHAWGWKTRRRDLNSRAPDDAVRIFNPTDPVLASIFMFGEPIWWPTMTMSWDMAFELTTKEIPPKKPVPHLKWSQPPIEIDPNSEEPVYSGWDEISYIDQIDTTRDPLVADDYRCLGSMPVTSIHWWGSHYGLVEPGATPPVMPIGWKIGFWTNVPAPDGEWDIGDPHKMHHPQLPDPNGWDLDITSPNKSADDWKCEKSGPVRDIHFWYSWLGDNVGIIQAIKVEIYDNVPDPDPGDPATFSHPGNLRWNQEFLPREFTTRFWGKGNQGFITPPPTNPIPDDHYDIYQCNIVNIPQPFYQTQGEIYWLAITIQLSDLVNARIGWKTTLESLQFEDDAVYLTPPPSTWAPWTDPETGVSLDLAFVITDDVPYSYPEKMLWEIKVPEDRVEVEEVGTDFYHHYHPNDVTYQYTLYLEPNEFFWQGDYLEDTTDDTFWLSIAAIYSPDIADIAYPWGWKTRPWHWMDDAVRFTYGGSLEPGIVLDPIDITPIKDPRYGESFDVAFELDTDPNYIKWEQPFTGIRRWPHYEDEKSMATEVTTTEHIVKWAQNPDLTETGIDVDATNDGTATSTQLLADDFPCDTTEPITNIHVYGSWMHEDLPNGDPAQVEFTLSIHKDIPADPLDPTSYSMPGHMLWSEKFVAGDFTVEPITAISEEGYYIPCTDQYFPLDHTGIYKYNFYPDKPFVQQGSTDNPLIYWLDVQATPQSATASTRFGWKTRDPGEPNFMDDATWVVAKEPYNGNGWRELRYPQLHPFEGRSIDLAFEITSDKVTTETTIHRLVADDWKCKKTTPVTDAVWWGSYIGYQYKPCHGQIMPLPVKPDYFLLTIWNDVPAGHSTEYPFSHPKGPDPIWKYKAYDYDEVLVGYDKHPHPTPGAASAREPVFRYSVRIPEDNWFIQEDVNNIYWFSVVAVYKAGTDPLYDWGWTNHKHVFNDDAVAGTKDATGKWNWTKLLDQLQMSQDMSFMLFTDPDCLKRTASEYGDWSAWSKPKCWCYRKQCRGDLNGTSFFGKPVTLTDLNTFKLAFNQPDPNVMMIPDGICADLNHSPFFGKRVTLSDLNIFKQHFNKADALVPICDQPPIYTGDYNFWTEP